MPPKPKPNQKLRTGPPPWPQRLKRQIDPLRGNISIITKHTNGNTRDKIKKKPGTILKKHKMKGKQLIACREDLKQTLQASAQ